MAGGTSRQCCVNSEVNPGLGRLAKAAMAEPKTVLRRGSSPGNLAITMPTAWKGYSPVDPALSISAKAGSIPSFDSRMPTIFSIAGVRGSLPEPGSIRLSIPMAASRLKSAACLTMAACKSPRGSPSPLAGSTAAAANACSKYSRDFAASNTW